MSVRIVYQNPDGGISVVIPTGETSVEHILANDIPPGVTPIVIDSADLPQDRTFREAWGLLNGRVRIGMVKAKVLAHIHRRRLRDEEFQPWDRIIALQIPGTEGTLAETRRAEIREAYAAFQSQIEAATTADQLKAIIDQMKSRAST